MTHHLQRGTLVGIPPPKKRKRIVGAVAYVSAHVDAWKNHQNLRAVFAQQLERLYQDTQWSEDARIADSFPAVCSMDMRISSKQRIPWRAPNR